MPESQLDIYSSERGIELLPPNSLSFDELFDHYIRSGFMYSGKMERIRPHMNLIKENWEKGWKGGKNILWTSIYKDTKGDRTGTLTIWKTTNKSWQFQHLTSEHSRAVFFLIASALNEGIMKDYEAGQNWYSPTNKFSVDLYEASTIFEMGNSEITLMNYFRIDPSALKPVPSKFKIVKADRSHSDLIVRFVEKQRGKLYCTSENLYSSDLMFDALNSEYNKLDLGRRRHFWIAFEGSNPEPKAVIIAYRGPFGFNFSYLENRCEIIADPSIKKEKAENLCSLLIIEASSVYFNDNFLIYPEENLFVLADNSISKPLENIGGKRIRQYVNGIWVRKDFFMWRDYLINIFKNTGVKSV